MQSQESDSSDMYTFVSKGSPDMVLLLSYLLHSILARLVAQALRVFVAHLPHRGLSQECTKKSRLRDLEDKWLQIPRICIFLICTTTTSRKRISIKDSSNLHNFFSVQLIPRISGESWAGGVGGLVS